MFLLLPQTPQEDDKDKTKHLGLNLYVKNLDDSITDEGLTKIFEDFGELGSVKVEKD